MVLKAHRDPRGLQAMVAEVVVKGPQAHRVQQVHQAVAEVALAQQVLLVQQEVLETLVHRA